MTVDETVECSACRGEVRDDATRCRHCGASFKPPWYLRWSTMVVGAVVVFVLVLWGVSTAISNSKDKAEDEVNQIECETGDAGACLDYLADD